MNGAYKTRLKKPGFSNVEWEISANCGLVYYERAKNPVFWIRMNEGRRKMNGAYKSKNAFGTSNSKRMSRGVLNGLC